MTKMKMASLNVELVTGHCHMQYDPWLGKRYPFRLLSFYQKST